MRQSVFHLANLCCPSEERLIRSRLEGAKGIERLEFNFLERELRVTHRVDEGELLTVLDRLGMEPALVAPASRTKAGARDEAQELPAGAGHPNWLPMAISGIAATAAEVVAWVTGTESSPLVIALALLSIAVGGRDTLKRGFLAIRSFTLNINFLMTTAILGAMLIGQWPEAAMVTFLFALAERIEAHSLDRARNAIRSLMEMTPERATVREAGGNWREVEAATVQLGQTVRVRPGERIPLDGVVTAGRSTVNQAPITGESIPVEKGPDDTVFAGSINERGSFEFQVTATYENTTLARIVRAVQQAQAERAPTQRFIDRFARYYTPAVVLLAILVAVVPPLAFGAAFFPWLYRALVLLVVSCPCALVISTPVTVVSGLAAAARRGILVKGGVYLEEGGRLKAVAFDKTGTLTHGRPVVTDIIPLTGQPVETLLQIAASLEAHSEHPVASAVVTRFARCSQSAGEGFTKHGDTEARRKKLADELRAPLSVGAREALPREQCLRVSSIPSNLDQAAPEERSDDLLPVSEFEAITGRGVKGRIDGQWYYAGNHRLAEETVGLAPAVEAELKRLEGEGKTTVVLASAREALAVIGIADTLRETSVEALHQVHALGVRTVMLTGDNQTTADAIAARVGIDDTRGNLLPEEKLAAVSELVERYGSVAMVGDGINDAPALAKASIGFAMGAAGTDTALETADVALMEDDLRKLPLFIALSRRTGRILAQNIALALAIKAVFFALAFAGLATLWMAVLADMGGSLLVVFNGLRLLRFRPPHLP